MVYQVNLLFNIPISFYLLGFVFCGSVCSYNFHWYLTPPVAQDPSKKLAWNLSNKPLHLILFVAGLTGSGVFALLMIEHWFWLCVTAFFTFLYSAPKIPHPLFGILKKVALAKTIFLAFAWTHVTTLLPLVMHSPELSASQEWFVVNRFFFIYAICILFDYRDVEEDRRSGIKSMITYMNARGVDILFWGSVMAYLGTSFILIGQIDLTAIISILIPGIILSLLYYYSKRNFSDYLYYFILDGLMMLSAPLLLLAKFAR
jgi:hypothetical protein